MWNKITELKYSILIFYYFLGVIIAVVVFQFITISLKNNELVFNTLIHRETGLLIISCLLGALIAGFVFLYLMIYNEKRVVKENNLWRNIKEKSRTRFVIGYMFAFSIGGFFWKLTMNIFGMDNYNNFFQTLFSPENSINYIGIMVAASVFGFIFTIGIIKRLRLLYPN